VQISARQRTKPQVNGLRRLNPSKNVPSQQTGAGGAPWWVKIRRWSPVVVGSGAAGSFLVFVVVVPGKDLGALSL